MDNDEVKCTQKWFDLNIYTLAHMKVFKTQYWLSLLFLLLKLIAYSQALDSIAQKDTTKRTLQDSITDNSSFKSNLSNVTPGYYKSTLEGQQPLVVPGFSSKNEKKYSVGEKVLPDSTTKKRIIRALLPKTYGNIIAGYDYGIVPFGPTPNKPTGYFSTQGNLGVSFLGLPLVATFYYSTLKSIAGLNNYFRVSFDPAKYKENLQQKAYARVNEEKRKLTGLLNAEQQLKQKLAFQERTLSELPSSTDLNDQLQKYNLLSNSFTSNPTLNNITNINAPNKPFLSDSLKNILPQTNSIKNPYLDSIAIVNSLISHSDSIRSSLNRYKSAYDQIDRQIKSIQNKISYLENPSQIIKENNPYQNKVENFVSGIKSLDIGLCYPNYSTFLVNGSTLKGVNIEWEKKIYFAFTYGKTINTLLTTNNIIQNQLQTARNLYNFFDFNNVKDSRKIAAIKFGVGKKESSHLFLGVLYGYGLSSYLAPTSLTNPEKNVVVELDGKYSINAANSIDLVYGKSALYQTGNIETSEATVASYLFSTFRSNAAMVRFNSSITKTKTKIQITGRLIDPFFKSYGVGFMRSDNLRFELKAEQAITSKLKLTGFYRRDSDNLLGTYSYNTSLQAIGITLNAKINKRLVIRGTYSPVVQNITGKDSSHSVMRNVNNISTLILSYSPRSKKFTSYINGVCSYYQLAGHSGKNYQSYTLTDNTTLSKLFKSDVSVSYLFNNSGDSLNNTFLIVNTLNCSLPLGVTVAGGVKFANNTSLRNQWGGLFKASFPLTKGINIELQGQKLILGDFYSNFGTSEIKRFPFLFSAKIMITW